MVRRKEGRAARSSGQANARTGAGHGPGARRLKQVAAAQAGRMARIFAELSRGGHHRRRARRRRRRIRAVAFTQRCVSSPRLRRCDVTSETPQRNTGRAEDAKDLCLRLGRKEAQSATLRRLHRSVEDLLCVVCVAKGVGRPGRRSKASGGFVGPRAQMSRRRAFFNEAPAFAASRCRERTSSGEPREAAQTLKIVTLGKKRPNRARSS